MKDLRNQIDKIDKEIIRLLAERFNVITEIGKKKKERNLLIQNKSRETELIEQLKKEAKTQGISPALVDKLYAEILAESRRLQKKE